MKIYCTYNGLNFTFFMTEKGKKLPNYTALWEPLVKNNSLSSLIGRRWRRAPLHPQATGDDLSAHDNANGCCAEYHGETCSHTLSTGCNTITTSIITAALAIDGAHILISTLTRVEQRRVLVNFQPLNQ
jgi:hypothetical protein